MTAAPTDEFHAWAVAALREVARQLDLPPELLDQDPPTRDDTRGPSMIPPHIDQILLRKAETAGPTKKMQLVGRLLIWFRYGEVVNGPFTDRWREDHDIRRLANRYEARLHTLALNAWPKMAPTVSAPSLLRNVIP